MRAYYNEIDPFCAQWLRNLIAARHIAPGFVDERSIRDVSADDVRGYDRVHLFAGIGIWDAALTRSGWPDDVNVWTGSCPCQPFSSAGRRKGTEDDRHLWPEMFRLAAQCRPPVLLGEQVASKDGLAWLDLVQADLERAGYATAAADLCAAGVGAPHIRQRLFWVAHADDARPQGRGELRHCACERATRQGGVGMRGLGQPDGERREECDVQLRERGPLEAVPQAAGDGGGLEGLVNGHWSPADWVLCRDPGCPRWRPVEPGTFPLAPRHPGDVGRLRAYGNSIVLPLATEFVAAFLDCRP